MTVSFSRRIILIEINNVYMLSNIDNCFCSGIIRPCNEAYLADVSTSKLDGPFNDTDL